MPFTEFREFGFDLYQHRGAILPGSPCPEWHLVETRHSNLRRGRANSPGLNFLQCPLVLPTNAPLKTLRFPGQFASPATIPPVTIRPLLCPCAGILAQKSKAFPVISE